MRQCCRCGELKQEEEFSWRNRKIGMRHYHCKTCALVAQKKYAAANTARVKAGKAKYHSLNAPTLNAKRHQRRHDFESHRRNKPPDILVSSKKCSACGNILPANKFNRCVRNPDWLSNKCKDCTSLFAQEWKRKNPERAKRMSLRSRLIRRCPGSRVNDRDIAVIRAAQHDHCACCRMNLKGRGEIDHIVPVSRGGGGSRRNLQLLCGPCNRSKGARDANDFMRIKGYLI